MHAARAAICAATIRRRSVPGGAATSYDVKWGSVREGKALSAKGGGGALGGGGEAMVLAEHHLLLTLEWFRY